ncbi:MAG: hypothetical protein M3N11_05995, partial [Actinomycetota bacterium]|nr:hypothetical protein [Actinomycetota bacterium]
NLVLTDGTSIAATTCGDSLFVLDETGAGSDVGGRVTVASEPWDDDGGWREVPDRSLVMATRARVTVEPLPVPVPGPPG